MKAKAIFILYDLIYLMVEDIKFFLITTKEKTHFYELYLEEAALNIFRNQHNYASKNITAVFDIVDLFYEFCKIVCYISYNLHESLLS